MSMRLGERRAIYGDSMGQVASVDSAVRRRPAGRAGRIGHSNHAPELFRSHTHTGQMGNKKGKKEFGQSS